MSAPVDFTPGSYPATTVLGAQQRHLLNRFTYGITDETVAQVRAAGGGTAWFDQQIRDARRAPYRGEDWWPDLHRDAASIWQRQVAQVRGSWEVGYDHAERTMLRRLRSPQQVLEVMDEFWQNHFHVPLGADNVGIYRAAFGEAIRARALGRFDRLLRVAVLHPALLFYLDAAESTKDHPNENLGRELLELYTVGVGAYSEADVVDSARLLTGYTMDMWRTWVPSYRPEIHATGAVQVGDFRHANTNPDGRRAVRAYLNHLARRPATARHLARKLVRAFVSDEPQPALEAKLARIYLRRDTAIVPMLKALIRSPEFASAVDAKVRDADEDLAATFRLMGASPQQPRAGVDSASRMMLWQSGSVGLLPYGWPRPDGQPVDNGSWSTPSRALASMGVHWSVAGRWWPDRARTDYRQPLDWHPQEQVAFRDLVDHLARRIHHRPSTARLLQACCEATGWSPERTVTASADLYTWRWPALAATLLDSPEFYVR